MSFTLSGPAFDREKCIAIIPGRDASVKTRHIFLLSALLGGTVLSAGLLDGANPIGVSLGAMLVFFATGVVGTTFRNEARRQPDLVIDKTGITLRGFLRRPHVPWSSISEISQQLRDIEIVLLVHLRDGRVISISTGRIPRWARDKLFFIMKTLAQRNRVMWSVFEPALWSVPDSTIVVARTD